MSRSRRGSIALKPRSPTYQHWWKALANRTMRTRARQALKAGQFERVPLHVREVADFWGSPHDFVYTFWGEEAEWQRYMRK